MAASTTPIQYMILIQKKESLTFEEFKDYRINNHGPRFLQLPTVKKNLVRYDQYHDEFEVRKSVENALGIDNTGYDGVSVHTFASIEAAEEMYSDPEFIAFRDKDRPNFCRMPDVTKTMVLLGTPTTIYDRNAGVGK